MIQFSYTVKDSAGIHARPAGCLVKLAKDSDCSVTLKKGDKSADCKKIFTVMALGVKCGDTVTVEVTGENEEVLAKELQTFMEQNL